MAYSFGRKVNILDPIDQFLTEFILARARDRYRSIFSLYESRWGKVMFHNFESIRIETSTRTYVRGVRPLLSHSSHSPQISIWDDPLLESIHRFADSEVDVFSTGHTKVTGHKRALLRDALTDYSLIFDGFVTIVPSSLYIIFDHDDNLTICRRHE
ncbi:MAG: hypothetical protein EAZ42_13520 [Verrucomicrobia bacterium]|nr:MAG: hypothetical protein EAZ42_13520 [Verrucomicrobiota bacterium]